MMSSVLIVSHTPALRERLVTALDDRYRVRHASPTRTFADGSGVGDAEVVIFAGTVTNAERVVTRLGRTDARRQFAVVADRQPSGGRRAERDYPWADAVLSRPLAEGELVETVETLLTRVAYDDKLEELFTVASRAASLETDHDRAHLAECYEYRRLKRRLDRLQTQLARHLDELGTDGFVVAVGA